MNLLPLLAPTALLLSSGHQQISSSSRASTPCMGFFDQLQEGLASAFENDDELGEQGPAGLKKKVQAYKVTFKGPEPKGFFEQQAITEAQALPNQKMKDVADAAGIPIRYSCMEGTCKICRVNVDGQEVMACTARMPKRDVEIEYREVKGVEMPKGNVKPTGGFPKVPLPGGFELPKGVPEMPNLGDGAGGLPNPFAAPEPRNPTLAERLALEERLREEEEAKNPKKGGWPFG